MMDCSCPEPGFCPVLRRVMSPWMRRVCRGEALTPEACASYRDNWQRLAAGEQPLPAQQPVSRPACVHLGGEVRREECGSCCGKVQLKVFACEQHGECTAGKELPGLACCVGCGDYLAVSLSTNR